MQVKGDTNLRHYQCRFGQLITFERTAARECFVYAVSGHCQSEKCS